MIRKKTKFLVRFFTKSDAPMYRNDYEYSGKNFQECVAKLGNQAKKYVTSFTVYVNGEKLSTSLLTSTADCSNLFNSR